ncbi:MAG: 16S rRNA (adenine(1518)-N(6)/adenine(1519)-N(6))-dimethyltransferase RsmA [Pseudomonadota bacterium]
MMAEALPPLREVIKTYGLSAQKSLGQNFLLDLNLTRKIARAAAPLESFTVLEIGPGPGGLTRALLENAKHVYAIEKDARCIAALGDVSNAHPSRLTVVNDDALVAPLPNDKQLKIVANLPYNVATVLLSHWLEVGQWPPQWASLTLLFQKEVAQRITAAPGSKAYGRLSVLSQWRSSARAVFDIPPRAFTPPPKVISTLVQIIPKAAPSGVLPNQLSAITAAAFGQRRKMLRQSLKTLNVDEMALCRAAQLDETLRADAVPVDGYVKLAQAFRQMNA